MPEFQLFRIKVYLPEQAILPIPGVTRRDLIILNSLKELPIYHSHKGFWSIGNLHQVSNRCIYFRIGRTTKRTGGEYVNGNFMDKEDDDASYTHAMIDTYSGVCAIAYNYKVSSNPFTIGNMLVRLLNSSTTSHINKCSFDIKQIIDPADFVAQLYDAHKITKFWYTFSRPNITDVNEYFMIPAQKATDLINAKNGKSELYGSELNPNVAEKVSNSVGAVGEEAGATIYENHGSKPKRIRLKNNPVTFDIEEVKQETHLVLLWERMMSVYKKIRSAD